MNQYEFQMLPGEYWWGGNAYTKKCPITEKSEFHESYFYECHTQTASFFVSSKGRYIWSDGPIKIDFSQGHISVEGEKVELVQAGATLREAYCAAQAAHFPSDGRRLADRFFRAPQVNTWMEFTYYPTQESVLRFARELIDHGFEPNLFILDEGWHSHTAYGDWEFDFARFPDPKAMVDELHSMGYLVMLWITPFVNCAGPKYARSLRPLVGTDASAVDKLYLRTTTGEVALTKWWNGYSAILNLTDEANIRYLDGQLQHLMQDYGVDGFKFDGGAAHHYNSKNIVNGDLPEMPTPYELNRAWNAFGRRFEYHEFKDTWQEGGKNCIERLHDRAHSWIDHGIDDLLPCAFVNGLLGHPFTCPDMVGGGSWSTKFQPGFHVDEELFVRMAQCSALFPMMQFSWAPWEALSPKNEQLCLDMAKLHRAMSDEILALVRSAEQTGEPIVRLLEYNDPGQGYEAIDDEFMLGEDILVAPVVTEHTYTRTVTFPKGTWQDAEGNRYAGRNALQMDAPIEKLLWFRKVKD